MNFLLGNATGGDDDGWEDEEDLDLSDASLDGDDDVDGGDRDDSRVEEGRIDNSSSSGNNIQLGAGAIMGRLTRFLGAVTNPDDDDDDDDDDYNDQGGWKEDDEDLDDIIDDDARDQTAEGWGGDVDMTNGDDHDHYDGHDVQVSVMYDQSFQTTQAVIHPPPPPPPPPGVPPANASSQFMNNSGGGWDDDVNLSAQLMNTSTFSLATSPAAREPDAIIPLNDTDASGWEAEDDLLEGIDCDVSGNERQGHPNWAAPPPLPPPQHPPQHTQSNISSLSFASSFFDSTAAIASTIASTSATIATSVAETPGWDDDDVDVDLESDDEDVARHDGENMQGLQSFSTTTIRPPPPPPPQHLSPAGRRDISSNSIPSVSFAGETSTMAAVATSADDIDIGMAGNDNGGWDDDDGLLDDVEATVDEDDHQQAPLSPLAKPSKIVDLTPPPPPSHPNSNGTHNTLGGRTDAAVVIDDDNASLEDGWDDDDVGINDILDDDNDEANIDLNEEHDDIGSSSGDKLMVDHIPPPSPLGHNNNGATADAIYDCNYEEDDDISRDDTLSMANSRSQQPRLLRPPASLFAVGGGGETVTTDPLAVVDRTPETGITVSSDDYGSMPEMLPQNLDEPGSMAVLHEDANSSLDNFSIRSGTGDSIATASTGGGAVAAAAAVALSPVAPTGTRPTVNAAITYSSSNPTTTNSAKQRRMVDHTPRFARGNQGDASLLVAGHTSVGESLDSIGEGDNEEDDDASVDQNIKAGAVLQRQAEQGAMITPRTMESGFGALRPHQAETLNTAVYPDASSPAAADEPTEIPFGSALTPTVNNNVSNFQDVSSMPALAPYENAAGNSNDHVVVPVVDHTPLVPKTFQKSATYASVDVLSDSSEDGDLGESDVGVDDIKEDLYGPMVDHTPCMPDASLHGPTSADVLPNDGVGDAEDAGRQGCVEDDTVVGHAEKKDVDFDIQKDEEWDDDDVDCEESSRGESSTLGGISTAMGTFGEDNRSLRSGRLAVVDETQHVVDHVPMGKLDRSTTDASTLVVMDASSASSRVEDNVDEDGTNVADFGPIVDHTPTPARPVRGAPSVATSVVTQMDEDEMDNTTVGLTGGVEERSNGDRDELHSEGKDGNHIVDRVPKRRGQLVTVDASVQVLVDIDEVDIDEEMTQVDTIAGGGAVDFGPIVDHTPYTTHPPTTVGVSVGASMMTQGNGDSVRGQRDDDLDNTTTLGGVSLDAASGWDHDEPDLEELSANDVDEPNDTIGDSTTATYEGDEKNVVDHVPRRSFGRPADASTLVLVDPLDAVSEVDDGDDGMAGSARSDRFGLVVDHTPAPLSLPVSVEASMLTQANDIDNDIRQDDDMDGTWFGASTVGGISTVGASSAAAGGYSSGGDDDDSGTGWNDDAHILESIASPAAQESVQGTEDHLVDHVPPLASPLPVDADASMAVVVDPSVISSEAQDDAAQDEKTDEGLFGAVVDHTPSVEPAPRHGGDNSLSTVVTGIATDLKRDEEMDETTWQGGMSAQGEGWDQDDAELEELADVNEDVMPHVVDHVPERPASRPVDPSIIVAADPSEMSSQVDDFNQDEQNFGPVVDLTPIERAIPAPAVGSTVVALPSVFNDDLDFAEGDADEQTQEDVRPPNQWEEQLPNPQSGNDDDSSREQLVDFLPPPEEEVPDLVRDGSSEMATVDEKSTLPADDPKEDEFGPVVDHTPTGEPCAVPESDRIVGADEEDERKPAGIPPNPDSVAPMFSVASEEKEDCLDEDEFGPVVDHLPNGSSRASLAPSRGGSTVDALATVSEVEDDLHTRDGWDEDTIDLVDQTSPTATIRDDRSYSVTWVDSVNKREDSQTAALRPNHTSGTQESGFFDAEMGGLPGSSVNETIFYDPEVGNTNGWADDSLNFDNSHSNIADDVTPPSTPRTSMDFKSQIGPDCQNCATGTTTDCPCVQALLEANAGKGQMVGFLKTPEGVAVKVNFETLLVTEKSKRILVERESDALRATIKSLKASRDRLCAASDTHLARDNEMMAAISQWQKANAELSEEVVKFEGECTQLRNTNDILSNELASLQKSMALLEDEKSQIQSKEAALLIDIDNLKRAIEIKTQESTVGPILRKEIDKIRLELSAKHSECSELNSQVNRIQEKLDTSEATGLKFAKDLAKLSKDHVQTVSHLEQQLQSHRQMLEEKNASHESAVVELQRCLLVETANFQKLQQEMLSVEADNRSLAEQVQNLVGEHQRQISEKEGSIRRMELLISNVQNEKTKLSSEVSRLAQLVKVSSSASSALAAVSRERDILKAALGDSKENVKVLQNQIDELNMTWNEKANLLKLQVDVVKQESLEQEGALKASGQEITALSERLNKVESEKSALQIKFETLCQSHASLQANASSALEAINEDTRFERLENEIHDLREQLHSEKSAVSNSESERSRMSARCAELEAEVERLGKVAAETENLHVNLYQIGELKKSQDQRIYTLEGSLSEAERLLKDRDQSLITLREREESLRCALEDAQDENSDLLSKVEEMETHRFEYETDREELKNEVEGTNSVLEALNVQLTQLAGERDFFRRERSLFEEENEEMLVQFGLLKGQLDENDAELVRTQAALQNCANDLQEERRKLNVSEQRLQAISRDFEMLSTQRNGVDSERENMKEQLAEENDVLRDKIKSLTSETISLSSQVRTLEAEKSSLDGTIKDLRAQVDESVAASETKESELRSIISTMEAQIEEITNKSQKQEIDLDRLEQEVKNSKMVTDESLTLRHLASDLEARLSETNRLLDQKDRAVHDLQSRLEYAGRGPNETAELENLRREIQKLEFTSMNDKRQLQEMEILCDDTQQELTRTMEQLQASEVTAEELKIELGTKTQEDATNRMLEIRLSQVEHELVSARTEESRHREEALRLRQRITSLEMELRDARTLYEQPAKEPSGQGSAEIESLRKQIEALKRDQEVSSSQTGAREEMIEREVHALQDQMKVKDSEIASMEQELRALGKDLSQSHQELASKEEHVKTLSSELETLKFNGSELESNRILELTQVEAECVDQMRVQIISLAHDLETSENRRAEFIERVEKERQANADSLRRMTDSIKRFYATMNFGDS